MAAGPTYEPIQTYTLSSAASSIDFTSIPATYTDLVVIVQYATSLSNYNLFIRCNGISTTVYSVLDISNITAAETDNTNQILIARQQGAGTTMNNPGFAIVNIFNYTNTSIHKQISYQNGAQTSSGNAQTGFGVAVYKQTTAVTQVNLSSNSGVTLSTGTRATLYGIKAA
jgi:hypothetical protein